MTSNIKQSLWLLATVLCAVAMVTTNAQNIPPCAAKLAPCLAYLNSTSKPPLECCIPLRMVIKNELPCLCNLLNTSSMNGGNVTQAVSIAARCGISTDLSVCAMPPASSPSSPPTGMPSPPPPMAGTGSSPPPSGAAKIASSAGVLGVFCIWVSIMLN